MLSGTFSIAQLRANLFEAVPAIQECGPGCKALCDSWRISLHNPWGFLCPANQCGYGELFPRFHYAAHRKRGLGELFAADHPSQMLFVFAMQTCQVT